MNQSTQNLAEKMLAEARRLTAAGISVVPVKTDGSKAVALTSWLPYQKRQATDDELVLWFSRVPHGIAVLCGEVSGNLEALDFDEPGLWGEFTQLADIEGLSGLLATLPVVQTPSGGVKVFWRSGVSAPRTAYLAYKPVEGDPERRQIRIETQGEGKSSLVAPSPAGCHPAGVPYAYLQGHLADAPTITAGERDALLSLARTFNLWTPPAAPEPKPRQVSRTEGSGLRPGDDFNARGEWGPLLKTLGLECKKATGEISYWGWADADKKYTCSVGRGGHNQLYNFSSNAFPLEPDTSYSLFGAYALIQHGGDFFQATKALAADGYGTPNTPPRVGRSQEPQSDGGPSSVDEDEPGDLGSREGDMPEPGRDFLLGVTAPSSESFNFTDLGNAKRLVHLFGADIRYCHAWQQWLLWNGRYWQPDASGGIYRLVHRVIASVREEAEREALEERRVMLRQWAVKCEALSRMEAMVKAAQALPGVPIDVPQLDREAMKLTVQNGAIDLSTGELLPHSRADFSTKLCPVRYGGTGIPAPLWDKFLWRVLDEDSGRIDFMARATGFALTADSRRRPLVILHGDKGRNGKSTFLDTITALMGDYGMTTRADTLMVKRGENAPTNDIARLRSARFVAVSESDEGSRLSEGLIKQMTGNDVMTARFLHQEFFDFKPEFKLFFATNHEPEIRGTDEGLWDRIRMIPFEVRIPDEEIDEEMDKKLLSELPGILAWCVRGCLAWQKGGLGIPESVAGAIASYRKDMDVIGQFLDARCILGEDIKTPATALYKAYQEWCEDNGEKFVEKQTGFGRKLGKKSIMAEKTGGVVYRTGIGLLAQGYS